jgi:tetratricopeptide (TPR) repeat protein
MRQTTARAVMVAAGVIACAGCATATSHTTTARFVLHRGQRAPAAAPAPRPAADTDDAAPTVSLDEAIGKIRSLMARARPEPKPPLPTIETEDADLKIALARAAAEPTALHYCQLANLYLRFGLLDTAYDYYTRALRLNPKQADAYEGLARVWRNWGMPNLALGDAHRAVYYAPESASAHNTLGTILQALGLRHEARDAYMMILAFEPEAAYAFNNLCYLSFLDGRTSRALAECQTALRLDPQLAAAHNNLALTFAASGRFDLARSEFIKAGGPSAAAYNMGIVYLAGRQYAEAAGAFADAAPGGVVPFDVADRLRDAQRRAAIAAPHQGNE